MKNRKTPLELFSDVVVINKDGHADPVPIELVDEMPLIKLETDQIKRVSVPYLYLRENGNIYNLHVWAFLTEDVNMMIEQVIMKFGHEGKNEESGLVLKATGNNTLNNDGIKILEYTFLMHKE